MSLLLALGLASLNIFMLLYIRDVKVWYYHIKVLQVCSIHNDYSNKSLLSVCYLWTGRHSVLFLYTPALMPSTRISFFCSCLSQSFKQTLHVNI